MDFFFPPLFLALFLLVVLFLALALEGVFLADPAEAALLDTLFLPSAFLVGFLLVIFLDPVAFLGAFFDTLLVAVFLAIQQVRMNSLSKRCQLFSVCD